MLDIKKVINIKRLYNPLILIVLFIFFILFFALFKNFFINYLWFNSLGHLNVYLKVFTLRLQIFLFFFFITLIIFFLNFLWVKLNVKSLLKKVDQNLLILNNFLNSLTFLILAFIFSLIPTMWWDKILNFLYAVDFKITDPLFHKDIGFYVFKFSLLKLIHNWLLVFLFTILFINIIYYYFSRTILFKRFEFHIPRNIRVHLGLLLCLIFIHFGIGLYFQRFDLLLKQGLMVKGAAYIDVHSNLLFDNIFAYILVATGLVFIYWTFKPSINYLLYTLFALFICYIIFHGVIPFTIDQFIVKPNEIDKEKPYIENTIKFTRQGFNINNVKKIDFQIKDNLTLKSIDTNIINNICLYDLSSLKATINQLQTIRPYYIFPDLDIDRYFINNKERLVMSSIREITHNNLPREARNWINRYLIYTHGYGLIMMPVNTLLKNGKPEFFIDNIPPVFKIDVNISRPEIYFGETASDYIIVNTLTKEFDYPSAAGNKYSNYTGKSGILLDKKWKKFLLALYLNDYNLLFSKLITPKSKVIIQRNIIEIVKKLVPFLLIDNAPYIVTVNGQLYWFLDGYTYTDKFPCSEIYNDSFNYIRNSVKIILNAYTGEVNIYIVDTKDPLIKVYQNAFPGLFKNINYLPEEFKKHFRYPMDLFMAQAEIYKNYHITDANIFFNRDDMWEIPLETYENNKISTHSYYLMDKILGETNYEFLNILPFSPAKEDSMIGLLMGRSDEPHYGELVAYNFLRKKVIYGPLQVELFLNQNEELSKLITQWEKKDSKIVKGHVLILPMKNSIVYIEPLFIYSEKNEIPELKHIVVFYNNNLALADNLTDALKQVLSGKTLINNDELINKALTIVNRLMRQSIDKNQIKELKGILQKMKY